MRAIRRILVTGSSGRLGRAVCRAARARYEVVGMDRLPGPETSVLADIRDEARVAALCDGVDAIVHAAALHAPHVGHAAEDEFRAINVAATRALARIARAAGAGRFVFTSSTAVYGARVADTGEAEWVDEAAAPRPRTIYHRTKLEAEAGLADLSAERFRVAILRVGRCFPEPAPVMAVYRLHRGVDARDVADAHVAALEAPAPACAVHVVSGTTPFERDDRAALGTAADAVLERRCPALVAAFRRRGWPLPRTIDRVYDNAAARRALGWTPVHGYESVLDLLDSGSAEVLAPAPRIRPG